jgi:hypothetical protein
MLHSERPWRSIMIEPDINSCEIRELTSAELEAIAGGVLPLPQTPASPLPELGISGHHHPPL